MERIQFQDGAHDIRGRNAEAGANSAEEEEVSPGVGTPACGETCIELPAMPGWYH